MEHFWKTVEVIPEGIGFAHYGALHLCWLAAFAVLAVLNCILYRKLGRRAERSGESLWHRCWFWMRSISRSRFL